jgi:hypothetical protein
MIAITNAIFSYNSLSFCDFNEKLNILYLKKKNFKNEMNSLIKCLKYIIFI